MLWGVPGLIRRLPEQFLVLCESNPEHPKALEIIRQTIQLVGSTDSAAINIWHYNEKVRLKTCASEIPKRTVRLLSRHFKNNKRLGPICDRMRYAYRLEFA